MNAYLNHHRETLAAAIRQNQTNQEILLQSQGEVDGLKHSLEEREREVRAITVDLEKTKSREKTLLKTVASLEAQVGF